MNQVLREISKKMIQRYSERYKELGYDIKTLGWGSEMQQQYRFSQTLQTGLDFTGKKILDIGCGFGDYANFLKESDVSFSSYTGIDINPDLIHEASMKHKSSFDCDFRVFDMVENTNEKPMADIGIMLGLLNLNLKDDMDNYDYTFNMIENAFSFVNEALVVDFISSKRYTSYPKEDFIFYHDPNRLMDYGLSITDNVLLKHDYQPIPQKEFMLVLLK